MPDPAASQSRAIWGLGTCQLLFWGVLYYGFAVWQVPMRDELKLTATEVAAAFSLGLLMMALLAPRVGRLFDQGHGHAILRGGLMAAVVGLVLLAAARSNWVLYLAWTLIGTAMAGLLYESAFALVQHAVQEPAQRLRALAAVTVMGGLASTVCLPALGWIVEASHWRVATCAGAAVVLLAGLWLERGILPRLTTLSPSSVAPAALAIKPSLLAPQLLSLMAVFATATMAAMALTVLLVPHLVAQGYSLAVAASVLAVLGLAQLPGRVWMLRQRNTPRASSLTVWPLLLQSLGLLTVAIAATPLWAAVGVALFGLGAGLHTLARPWLVQQRYSANAGFRNGQIAQAQGIGRALTPLLAAGIASLTSTATVLIAFAALTLLLIPIAQTLGRAPPAPNREQAFGVSS